MRCRPTLREAIERAGQATLYFELRPDWSQQSDRAAVAPRGKQSLSNSLRKARAAVAGGDRPAAGSGEASGKSLSRYRRQLAELIKAVPVELNGVAPIARAISTAGGIAFDELDAIS